MTALPCTAAFSLYWRCIHFLPCPDLPWQLPLDFSIVLHIVNVYVLVPNYFQCDIPDSASFPSYLPLHDNAHSPDSSVVDKITVFLWKQRNRDTFWAGRNWFLQGLPWKIHGLFCTTSGSVIIWLADDTSQVQTGHSEYFTGRIWGLFKLNAF